MKYLEDELDTQDDFHWYVIHTHPKQEDRAENNLNAWNVQTFNPKLKERRLNPFNGKAIYMSKHLFACYIFARFDDRALLHKVCSTRGVHSVVNFGNGPVRVDDWIVEFIQSQVSEDGFIRMGEEFKAGDQVVVKSGPLESLMGIFKKEIKGTDRVMILLGALNYTCNIIVERDLIKKVKATGQQIPPV
jgi:transcriptional antiterminator RfaH